MSRISRAFIGVVAALLFSAAALAGKFTPADYPLRVHIFQFNGHSHYYAGLLEMADGEGRANLYENGEPRGFDFSYRCGDRLRVSVGYETYMAKWKKTGKEIEILMPVFGKPGAMEPCQLMVAMKDVAYHRHNGALAETPIEKYKEWMQTHQYDPEHGKDVPVAAPPAPPASGQTDPQHAPASIGTH